MVSISTSGLELWGFESFERPLVWGHKTKGVKIDPIMYGGRIVSGGRKVHSRSLYFRFRRYTAPVAYIGTLKGTCSKSQRLYNGVMLKISPTKGHKESR